MLELLANFTPVKGPGYGDYAEKARRRILDMVAANGFHENYNAASGARGFHSREHFSWSASIVIAMALRRYNKHQPHG